MSYLVLSHKHELLPFAWRLHREGHEVETVVWKERYEAAWDGLIEKAVTGPDKGPEAAKKLDSIRARYYERAASGELTVLTNFHSGQRVFGGAPRVFGTSVGAAPELPPLAVGGWFNGERFLEQHVTVGDVGLWPGGAGARCLAGLTLIRHEHPLLRGFLEATKDELKSESFRGLVSVPLSFNPVSKEFSADGYQAGWPVLHSHAFLSELPSVGSVLEGSGAIELPKRCVVVAPVTVPPWPLAANISPEPVPIEGEFDRGGVFFHDMKAVEKVPTVAGLDGFVAVARGAADHFQLARWRAIALASQIELPQRQLRTDVGSSVDSVLAGFEELGLG